MKKITILTVCALVTIGAIVGHVMLGVPGSEMMMLG
jgi:uncharacterized transporter YbjL